MHAIGIRRSIVEKHPWVAVNVYKAFLKAKALCMDELGQIGHLHVTLPWPVHAHDHARKVMGEDYWPYGAHENKLPLETLARIRSSRDCRCGRCRSMRCLPRRPTS